MGASLAVVALRIFGTIVSSAYAVGSAAHHELAFFRGLSSKMILHAHSDEGGWIRQALRCADYPPPQGLLVPLGNTGAGIPLVESIAIDDCTRWAVAFLLRGAGIMSAIKTGNNEYVSICETDETGRPGGVRGLFGIYSHLTAWRTAVERLNSYMPESVSDSGSMQALS